jgi:tetratricopeptide (TPR) repeat protein
MPPAPPKQQTPNLPQALELARELRRKRRLRDAEKILRGLLQLDAAHAGVLHELGMVCAQLRRPAEAESFIRRALALDSIAARADLGFVLAAQNRFAEAQEELEKVLAADPGLVGVRNNLGNLLHVQGRNEESVVHFERALALKPASAEIRVNLANALLALGRHEAATVHLEAALAVAPGTARTYFMLAGALIALGRHADAEPHYRKAIELKPGYSEAHSNLGLVLASLGRHEDALASFRAALALKPDLAEAHAGSGQQLKILGCIDEARQAFARAVQLAPRRGEHHRGLAELTQFTSGNPQLAAMEALAEGPIPEADLLQLHFALGKAYADIGAHEKAFHHFVGGNALKRRREPYNEAETLGNMARIARVFSRELIAQKAMLGDRSELPVFVVGMPRSGTTLIEQMLASHPRVVGAGERPDIANAVNKLQADAGVPFPELVLSMGERELRGVAADYLAALGPVAPLPMRITDKMPTNFLFAGLIHMALPGARILHACRDPLDTCVSCFSKLFASGMAFTYDLAELGRYYRGYRALMAHWREVLPPGVMLDVQYEELVADFESQARRIVAFCGLEWDARCLAFHATQRPVRTASALQVREPVYTNAVGRWQPYAPMIRPLLEALGGGAQASVDGRARTTY